jgi:hypothetical protein
MSPTEHLMASAERELAAFMRAVSEMFGAEHARRAADDWLDELDGQRPISDLYGELAVLPFLLNLDKNLGIGPAAVPVNDAKLP